jgi:hypothetical protein
MSPRGHTIGQHSGKPWHALLAEEGRVRKKDNIH